MNLLADADCITIAIKRKKEEKNSFAFLSLVTCHLSFVTCQASHIMCYLSHVTCHMWLQKQPQQQTLSFVTPPQCTAVEPRIPKILLFQTEKLSKTQKLKNVYRYVKIRDKPFDKRSLIHQEAWFLPCFARENQKKKKTFLWGNFTPFVSKNFKSETAPFHFFSPKIQNI